MAKRYEKALQYLLNVMNQMEKNGTIGCGRILWCRGPTGYGVPTVAKLKSMGCRSGMTVWQSWRCLSFICLTGAVT